MSHTKPCDRCVGTGVVDRQKRRLADGSVDPTDVVIWPKVTCDKCGGSGEISYVPEPKEAA